jgi:hypothetical protein
VVQALLRYPRIGWTIVVAGAVVALVGVGPSGLPLAVSVVGLLLVRGWRRFASPSWFDDPFWRDWLFWAGVLPCALLLSVATTAGSLTIDGSVRSWVPAWLTIAVASLVSAYPFGLLTGTIRAFVRGLRSPNRA